MIQVRYSTSPSSVETAHAADLRENFLVEDLFETGEVHAVYTHDDRMVVGGAVPGHERLELPAWTEVLGVESHLERRELGIVNVGGDRARPRRRREVRARPPRRAVRRPRQRGRLHRRRRRLLLRVRARGRHLPDHRARPRRRRRRAPSAPPRAPASGRSTATPGGPSWRRPTLQFGVTVLADGSVWNTLPPHLHDRRTEVYLYVDLAEDEPRLPLPRQARRHPAPRGAQPAGRHLAPVVHPRRRRHQLLRLHLGDVRREHAVHRPRARRAGGAVTQLALRPVRQARRRDRRRSRPRPGRRARPRAGGCRPGARRPARQPDRDGEGGPRPRPRGRRSSTSTWATTRRSLPSARRSRPSTRSTSW